VEGKPAFNRQAWNFQSFDYRREISVLARHPLLGAAKDIGATVGDRYTKILQQATSIVRGYPAAEIPGIKPVAVNPNTQANIGFRPR